MDIKLKMWLNGVVLALLLVFTISVWQDGVAHWESYGSLGDEYGHNNSLENIVLGFTERVSVSSDGEQGNSYSGDGSDVSANGRYVAFNSLASNLVPGDEGWSDIFVRDRLAGQTERISIAIDGTQATGGSCCPSISADGRYVAFRSSASNLVSGDTNSVLDSFVYDRDSGRTERVSVSSDGTQGNNNSWALSISPDGRYATFASYATNLVAGDMNGTEDVFVHDRLTGETELISVASDGTQGNDRSLWSSISPDGRYVAFWSAASNLVSGDTNGEADIFMRDRIAGHTIRISVDSNGNQGNGKSLRPPTFSDDGRYVAFSSRSNNLVSDDTNEVADIFLYELQTGQIERVSVASDGAQGNGGSAWSSLSADGRFVAFDSLASNLVSGDTNKDWDVFVHDRQTGLTMRVSVASDGEQGNDWSNIPAISADGHSVVFTSLADNLVPGDTLRNVDVFVHEWIDAIITYLPIISR